MSMGYNYLDPMNHPEYITYTMPTETLIQTVPVPPAIPSIQNNPNKPEIKPQPKEDKFYKFDGNDDGQINKWEKIKAFAKGSTYNIAKSLFCSDKGFSIKKTALTLGCAAALALTGPIGIAVAGAVGLGTGVVNFVNACKLSNTAKSDVDARIAYEKLGESTTTMGLSLFGGFKGLKFLKNNSKFAKSNPAMNISKWAKLSSWKLS